MENKSKLQSIIEHIGKRQLEEVLQQMTHYSGEFFWHIVHENGGNAFCQGVVKGENLECTTKGRWIATIPLEKILIIEKVAWERYGHLLTRKKLYFRGVPEIGVDMESEEQKEQKKLIGQLDKINDEIESGVKERDALMDKIDELQKKINKGG